MRIYAFFTPLASLYPLFLRSRAETFGIAFAGVKNGHRVDCWLGGDVGRHGRDGGRARRARRTQGRAFVIGLEVLYGFGGLLAVILFAYLVFALICAEEF